MSNAIPFEDWLDKQGDDVFLAMCDGHPSTIILVDKTDFAVYRYTSDKAENAKLRELVRDYLIFYSQPGCTYCFCHDECRESEEPCMAFERLVDRTNELGIEVSE